MLAVVIVTSNKGVEAAGEAVDRGIVGGVILVRKDDVEVPVKLRSRQLAKVFRDER